MAELVLPVIAIAQFVSLLGLAWSQRRLNAAHKELVRAQLARLAVYEKLACCGCGHSLGRHDDPDSADGYGCRDCECQAVHNLVDTIERPRRN